MLTSDDAETIVTDIKRRYTPSTFPGAHVLTNTTTAHDYCVGGVVCAELFPYGDTAPHFPIANVLAHKYRALNEALDWETALYFANHTMLLSDQGDFDKAWSVVIAMLSYVS